MSNTIETQTMTFEEMEADILKKMVEEGYTHYKARAECFVDVIRAFHIIHEYNTDRPKQMIHLVSPTIKGSAMGDTDFDFWTKTPILTIQRLWDTNGKFRDLHRIIQTVKPIDKYDARTDNSVWAKLKELSAE